MEGYTSHRKIQSHALSSSSSSRSWLYSEIWDIACISHHGHSNLEGYAARGRRHSSFRMILVHVIKYNVTCIWMDGWRREREKPLEMCRCIRTLLVRIRIRPAATRSAGYTDVPGDAGDAGGLPELPSPDPLI